jgi:hypothetical protein
MQPPRALLLHATAGHVPALDHSGYVLAFARHNAWALRHVPGCTRYAALKQAHCRTHAAGRHAAAQLRPFTNTITSRGICKELKTTRSQDPLHAALLLLLLITHLLLLLQETLRKAVGSSTIPPALQLHRVCFFAETRKSQAGVWGPPTVGEDDEHGDCCQCSAVLSSCSIHGQCANSRSQLPVTFSAIKRQPDETQTLQAV